MENLIQARDLVKTYTMGDQTVHALRGVSIDIAKGEFLTLLGPSGSGKTTTLMLLAGFEHASSGQIRLDGKPRSSILVEPKNGRLPPMTKEAQARVQARFGKALAPINEGMQRDGTLYLLTLRLVPLFPFNLLNYALGLTRISLTQYVLASIVCMAPGTIGVVRAATNPWLGAAGQAMGAKILEKHLTPRDQFVERVPVFGGKIDDVAQCHHALFPARMFPTAS